MGKAPGAGSTCVSRIGPPLGPKSTHVLAIPPPTGHSSFFYLFRLDLALESCSRLQFLLKASLTAGALISSLPSASLPTHAKSHTLFRTLSLVVVLVTVLLRNRPTKCCIEACVCVYEYAYVCIHARVYIYIYISTICMDRHTWMCVERFILKNGFTGLWRYKPQIYRVHQQSGDARKSCRPSPKAVCWRISLLGAIHLRSSKAFN